MFLRRLFYSFNPRQRIFIRKIWYLPIDLIQTVFNKKEPLVPPKGLIYTGAGDFIAIGDKIFDKIITECKIEPDDFILDIGCGIGRIARPLTKYLNRSGAYYGFDIVYDGIKWCRRNYKQPGNFHFDYVPIKNDLYNLTAERKASEFKFPYEDHFFDLAISVSVFTHMQLNEVENYFIEISRVLKPGKYCFCTFFIITKEIRIELSQNENSFFKYEFDNYYLHDNRVKDANIAYKAEAVEKMAENAGLKIDKIMPGWWHNGDKNNHFDFQDIVILRKQT